jgi:hypothetical protein
MRWLRLPQPELLAGVMSHNSQRGGHGKVPNQPVKCVVTPCPVSRSTPPAAGALRVVFAFDLLHLDGQDLRGPPLAIHESNNSRLAVLPNTLQTDRLKHAGVPLPRRPL